MNMVESKLNGFFIWLMRESLRSTYNSEMKGGHACLGLADDMVLTGVEAFTKRIIANGGSEYRINNSGLKLYITINKPLSKIHVRIGGDQAGDYPTFVSAVKHRLIDMGLDEDTYFGEPRNPTVVREIGWRSLT